MCKNNDHLISDEQKILQTISLQDYVKRLWNNSNTKIPVTIGKGTDTAKPRSKAPHAGQWCDIFFSRVWQNKGKKENKLDLPIWRTYFGLQWESYGVYWRYIVVWQYVFLKVPKIIFKIFLTCIHCENERKLHNSILFPVGLKDSLIE